MTIYTQMRILKYTWVTIIYPFVNFEGGKIWSTLMFSKKKRSPFLEPFTFVHFDLINRIKASTLGIFNWAAILKKRESKAILK